MELTLFLEVGYIQILLEQNEEYIEDILCAENQLDQFSRFDAIPACSYVTDRQTGT